MQLWYNYTMMARITFNTDEETKRRARHKALDEHATLAEVLRLLLDAWLDDELDLLYKKAFDNGDNITKPRKRQ